LGVGLPLASFWLFYDAKRAGVLGKINFLNPDSYKNFEEKKAYKIVHPIEKYFLARFFGLTNYYISVFSLGQSIIIANGSSLLPLSHAVTAQFIFTLGIAYLIIGIIIVFGFTYKKSHLVNII